MRRFIALLTRATALWSLISFALSHSAAHADMVSPHGKLTLDCQMCHTTDNWTKMKTDSAFSHDAMTSYPLVGRHKGVSCISCHATLVFSEAATQCLDCHTDIHRGQFSNDCGSCHTSEQWADESKFRKMHESTRFPLIGVHATLDCQSCHANGQYTALSNECINCHREEFTTSSSPSHAEAGFSQNCTECHDVTAAKWKGPKFEHIQTFPLTGGHALNNCSACHATGYVNTSSACVECHQADYTTAQNPTHESGAFPSTCETCHTTSGWRPAEFANHSSTLFPLTGAHVQTNCLECHIGGQFTGTSTQCVTCHQDNYTSAQNPTHESGAFPSTCETCHTTSGWRPAEFANHAQTAFPLTGRHVLTSCTECHVGGQYSGTPTDCWSCHQDEYNGTTDPNHVVSGYSQNCVVCHSTENWTESTFDHDLTSFPLTGTHIQTNCTECHIGGIYDGTPTDCWSCHQDNYNDQSDHIGNNFPHDCAVCHNTVEWDQATFDHNNTIFPLTGAHVQTNCLECHIGGIYDGTPTDCWSCHEEDYNDAEDHQGNNYPHDCLQCHTTTNWNSNFNHNSTSFPLTGAHVETNCLECHIGGLYDGTPTDCWSCHEEDYNDAEDHQGNNYPHDCLQCHTTTNWNSNFNHNSTSFPLTGAHVQTNCTECHIGGIYDGTPTDCWSCHEEDYNDAEDHQSQNYPHDCTQCHNTDDWDSGFNHNNSGFPLTGAHVTTACLDCHIGGQFENTPTDCWFCHQADYNNATPEHNNGVPHECLECHTTTDWSSNFIHDQQYFPIYSGRHRGEWNACIECHTTEGNFAVFSCIECHEHDNPGDLANEHEDVNGYTYTPTSCYSCHPDGNGDGRRGNEPPNRKAKPRRVEEQK